jgi:hypothetical protein
MLPHEKAFVKRLEKEPFAMIGINTDQNLEVLKTQLKKSEITWRNVWEGQVPAGRGALSTAWNVRGYPTIYVIDAQGIIRSVNHGSGLEQTVDALLADLKKASANR